LALDGAYVIVHYAADEQGAAGVVTELQALGTLALGVEGDISTSRGVAEIFSFVEQSYRRLDLLVNLSQSDNVPPGRSFLEVYWDRQIALGLKSALLCSHAAAPLMKGRASAAVLNVVRNESGSHDWQGATSAAISGAVSALTRSLSEQLKPSIRVNCVEVYARTLAESKGESNSGSANDDIARTCVFLLSSGSRSINGQTIRVD
jgi:NAD(P)-dependent dehydrogenase (short-subunit alcohol dehydrogenase family)